MITEQGNLRVSLFASTFKLQKGSQKSLVLSKRPYLTTQCKLVGIEPKKQKWSVKF